MQLEKRLLVLRPSFSGSGCRDFAASSFCSASNTPESYATNDLSPGAVASFSKTSGSSLSSSLSELFRAAIFRSSSFSLLPLFGVELRSSRSVEIWRLELLSRDEADTSTSETFLFTELVRGPASLSVSDALLPLSAIG